MKMNTWGASPGGRLFNGPTVQLVSGLQRGYSIVGDWKEKNTCVSYLFPQMYTLVHLKQLSILEKRTQL